MPEASRLRADGRAAPETARPLRLRRPEWRVRRIPAGDPLGDVLRLRREVYFHEQGQLKYNAQRVADGLDASGAIYVVEEGAQAVATLRLHDLGPPPVQVEYGRLLHFDRFAGAWPPQSVLVGSRFAVQAEQRIAEVVDRLFVTAYLQAQEKGARFCLIACAPFLHNVFDYYGFREYLPPALLPGGDAVLRMALVVDDAPHLAACASPLRRWVRNPQQGAGASAWLLRAFGLSD